MKTDAQVARAWVQFQTNWWAYEQLSDACFDHPKRAWRFLGEIAKLSCTPALIEDLGCGPLEDFVRLHAPAFITQIERRAATTVRFRKALAHVSLPRATDELSQRLFALGCKPIAAKLEPWQTASSTSRRARR